jgi:hypothetical protein
MSSRCLIFARKSRNSTRNIPTHTKTRRLTLPCTRFCEIAVGFSLSLFANNGLMLFYGPVDKNLSTLQFLRQILRTYIGAREKTA